jgi:uncharacterized protein (DUF1501 family)
MFCQCLNHEDGSGDPSYAISRRQLMRGGLLSASALALPNVLRLRAASAAAGQPKRQTAVIFVQLGGGASQFETYDPKPDAPEEYRGLLDPIATNVPGMQFCELMPQQAKIADKLAVVRSVTHHEASHIALHVVESGYFLQDFSKGLKGEMPAVGSIVARVRGKAPGGLPAFVSLPRPQAYCGPVYLGGQYSFFDVSGDPSAADFKINNLDVLPALSSDRLGARQSLLKTLDSAEDLTDLDHQAPALDAFQQQALDLLTGRQAREAFDLSQESAKTRERYGQNEFGQRMLLARRLVEVGVPFVMVRTFDWDDHDKLFPRMQARCPAYDQGLATLIADLADRGMNRDVLVVSMGEFGRTPRVNPNGGRDHWPSVNSVLLAGGRYQMGQAIGATDSKGAYVANRPYAPQNVLAMVYHHLGIDPGLTFPDYTGRPRYVLEERGLIEELV